MEMTIAAQKMIQALSEVTSVNDLATVIGLAERFAKANGMIRVTTVHIEAAMERMTDPMAPDYDALAEAAILDAEIAYNEAMAMAQNEPTSQIQDCRDSAEVVGAQ